MNLIRHRVGIKASLEEVYKATFVPEKLQAWWAASAAGGTEVGSEITLKFPGFPNHVWEIADLQSNERVELKLKSGPDPWAGSELHYEFQETENQIFVTLTHVCSENTPDEAFQYFSTKWPTFLISLKQYLETGTGMPYPNDLKIQHD